MKKWTKNQQQDFDRYAKEGSRHLAEMLVESNAAYDRKSDENVRFRAALEEIAAYSDDHPRGASSENLSSLDEPDAARIARKALEKKR